MCGIIGILSSKTHVVPRIIQGLRQLEYRGYDSAGIATIENGTLSRLCTVGSPENLLHSVHINQLHGQIGIGHTRWATHGIPSTTNAHPQQCGQVAVVHNGIIENFAALKQELIAQGTLFQSETDTEVIAALTDHYLVHNGGQPLDAVRKTLARLQGAFALGFLFKTEDKALIVARQGSPLAIGYGEQEMFVGSDAAALAHMTPLISHLEDGDHAILTLNGARIFNRNNTIVNRPKVEMSLVEKGFEKGQYQYFMLKEIYEQPKRIAACLDHYIHLQQKTHKKTHKKTHTITIANKTKTPPLSFADSERLIMIGCGSAYFAAKVASYWFEKIAAMPTHIDIASEYRYRAPAVSKKDAALFISQSGETADTLAALDYCQNKTRTIIGLLNNTDSSLARTSNYILPIFAGQEISVPSTKAFTTMLATLAVLVLYAAQQRNTINPQQYSELVQGLRAVPNAVHQIMHNEAILQNTTNNVLQHAKSILFLGRGALYPIALEGALKIKETSYIYAEGYPSGELKHGPIALIDADTPAIMLAPYDADALFAKNLSSMQEIAARSGRVILITDQKGAHAVHGIKGIEDVIIMPDVHPLWIPIAYAVPLQIMAYQLALLRGYNPDKPRNLAKCVTVE